MVPIPLTLRLHTLPLAQRLGKVFLARACSGLAASMQTTCTTLQSVRRFGWPPASLGLTTPPCPANVNPVPS